MADQKQTFDRLAPGKSDWGEFRDGLFSCRQLLSLDAANRNHVVELIRQRRVGGAAIVGIFHDSAVRDALATHVQEVAFSGVQA